MNKILLLEGIHPVAVQRLQEAGFHVESESHSLAGNELIVRAKGFDALGIRSKTQLESGLISQLSDLNVIGAFCIGTNQVDLEESNRRGLPVFNAPYSNTRSVAELVIGEMIALARKLGDLNTNTHKGLWKKSAVGSFEVRGKTLGIVGYGHIGSQLSILAESMGLKVLFYDIIKKLPLGNAQAVDNLDDLLSRSDFVSFHVPETPLTVGMMGREQFNRMKKNSFFINASRGTVVDIDALVEAMKSERVIGAAIDVFPVEPASNREVFVSPLQDLDNVIMTPHIGGSTEEAQESIGWEVAESLIRYFRSGSTFGAVNFPQLDVPEPKDSSRILNVHRNVPGVLGEINSIVSDVGANIKAQYLATDPQIGYLIMDMEKADVDQVVDQINALETTIKSRVV